MSGGMSMIILCITAGRGPIECRQAVEHVVREMQRECQNLDLVCTIEAKEKSAGSAILSISGQYAEAFARSWQGTILWKSKSTARDGFGRKNWFVAVKRLEPPAKPPELSAADLRFETLRAGGPGGQHQNKTESAVRVLHVPSGISAIARDERSQLRNKSLAVERLRQILATLAEQHNATSATKDWNSKITIERGNPIRAYEGEDFRRK
jgi:peptide chain release factor